MKGSFSMKILPIYNHIQNIFPVDQNSFDYNMNNYQTSNKIIQTETKNVFQRNESAILSFKENEFNNNLTTISSYNQIQEKPPEIISTIYDKNLYRIQKKIFQRNQNPKKPIHISPDQYNSKGNLSTFQKYQANYGNDNSNINKLNLNKNNILDDIKNDLSLLEVKPIEELSSPRAQNTTPKKSKIYFKIPHSQTSRNILYSPNINRNKNKFNSIIYNYTNYKDINNNIDINNSYDIVNNKNKLYNINSGFEDNQNTAFDNNINNIINNNINNIVKNIDFNNEDIYNSNSKNYNDIINTNEDFNNNNFNINNKDNNNNNNFFFINNNNEYNINNSQQYSININLFSHNNNEYIKNNNDLNNYNYQETNDKENINNNVYNINKNYENNFINGYNIDNNEYYEKNKLEFNDDLVNTQIQNIYNQQEEIVPQSKFNLSEFTKIGQVGKGTEGTIFSVKWKKNNKKYALKKSKIINVENVKKRQEEIMMLKNFRKNTGSDGVIQIYGDLCINRKGYYDFYEIMELAEMDWEQEIYNRGQIHLYYEEDELMDIMGQIVKTFSLLQKNHITHRDIKPQNIMIVNGKFKICDFGNARILKREGMVVQRIRGSEMYMSPIMFKGYHAKVPQVKHHTYKSDVFSLGMCFLLAAALSYNPLNKTREIYDNNVIRNIINQFLGNRYSQKIYKILFSMLQIEENYRPDFIQLETLFPN